MSTDHEKLLASLDPVLERIISEIPRPRTQTTGDVFHDLMSCVLEQQIHYRSSKKIFQTMLAKANIERLGLDNFHQFEEKAFENVKLATGKYETIASILAYWRENEVDWQALKDEEVRTKLSVIKGIGKWTIDMILLYTLQRPNVFPYDDFHLKQIMVSQYGLNPNVKLKAQMIEIAEGWGEQKSLAVKYLLAWKEHLKNKS